MPIQAYFRKKFQSWEINWGFY